VPSTLSKRSLHVASRDQTEVEALLSPVVALLKAAGLDLNEAVGALQTTWAGKSTGHNGLKIDRLGDPAACASVVSKWIRSPDYVDDQGNPRILSMTGKRGFVALVGIAAPNVDPHVALKTLLRYGNVTKNRKGKIRLLQTFLKICTDNRIAYEPSASFLADAADTVGASIGANRGPSGSGRIFWRAAETARLPPRKIASYLSYANRRSLAFLLEMDDWLEANSKKSKGGEGHAAKRVGLGIFAICSPIKPTPKT
jgi:hypothetical protein